MIDYMLDMRASNRNKVEDMATKFPGQAKFTAGKKAWSIPCDIALPCAFQNELSEDDAKELKANGCWCCCEVSNMGCQPGAIHFFQKNGVLFAPGKAVNAGGVATSGLEMTQNAAHLSWSAKEVDEKLHWILTDYLIKAGCHNMMATRLLYSVTMWQCRPLPQYLFPFKINYHFSDLIS